MKNFLKKILKYLILAAVLFAGSVVLQTYLKDKTFGFNIDYIGETLTIFITIAGVVAIMV